MIKGMSCNVTAGGQPLRCSDLKSAKPAVSFGGKSALLTLYYPTAQIQELLW